MNAPYCPFAGKCFARSDKKCMILSTTEGMYKCRFKKEYQSKPAGWTPTTEDEIAWAENVKKKGVFSE